MTNPLVTCVIPCHNGAATIERAIKSAIAAGCDEVLVYDDASTDNTFDLLSDLSQIYDPLLFFSEMHYVKAGVNFGRNFLIEMTDDRSLIIPLDCDDTLHDITPLREAWVEGTWVYGDHNEVVGEMVSRVKGSPPGSLPRKELTGITYMFHKQDWKTVGGYDPDFAYIEDYSMQCNLTHHGILPKYVDTIVYDRHLKPEGNERSVLAGAYWSFYRDMCRRKYPNSFAGTG